MKKYYFISVLVQMLILNVPGQNLSYEQKYEFYRERLNKYFVYKGTQPGECLPFRRDGFRLKTEDLPNLLGFYIGILATEYKLKQDAGKDVASTVQELHYALYTLNRLDTYDADIGNTVSVSESVLHMNKIEIDSR